MAEQVRKCIINLNEDGSGELKFVETYGYENRFTRNHTVSVYNELMNMKSIKGGRVFLSFYTTQRHFGGPEEGGWYQNWNSLSWSIPTFNDANTIKLAIEHMLPRIKEEVYGDIYSANGGQQGFIRIETPRNVGSAETTEKMEYC